MSRKKYNPRNIASYKGSQSPFAKRLTQLIEKHGLKQREVAEALEVQRQTVSLYTKGQALPDIACLVKMTKLFNVSADYLLGLTKTPTLEADKRAVCDYVGLSEPAVDYLHEIKDDERYSRSELLSNMISSEHFDEFTARIQEFVSEDAENRIRPYTDIVEQYVQSNLDMTRDVGASVDPNWSHPRHAGIGSSNSHTDHSWSLIGGQIARSLHSASSFRMDQGMNGVGAAPP